ncbi:fibrinogen silencer-binding protein-like [Dendronephthya gigantea]|uniref:fibrinogen silencer-binding protein-like n=1 Tax=Dendronephthya gigantea TaxID=151771 RepID=UPI00106AEAE6|nr:fibrinogen silencer-binding protein-like [Dendronephthya gigantea]
MADVLQDKQRKKRKLNFTLSEVNILLNKVEDNLEVIQSKLTNAITNKRKNAVWDAITRDINAAGVANRTVNEVKEKWKKLTSGAKKSFALIKKQQQGTGGGPPPKEASPVEERVIKLFENTPLFTGLDGFETAADNAYETVTALSNSAFASPSSHSSINDIELIEDPSPIPPSVLLAEDEKDEEPTNMNIPPSLPVPSRMLPALPGPKKSDNRKRTTNQDVLQLQVEVLTLQKEVLALKKQKLQIQIQNMKG